MFFFKQKTSYEMRMSDWSSDVCSSDLPLGRKSPGTSPPADRRGGCRTMSPEKPAPKPPTPLASSEVPWQVWSDVPRFAVRYRHLSLAALGEAYRELGRASFRETVCQYV